MKTLIAKTIFIVTVGNVDHEDKVKMTLQSFTKAVKVVLQF